MLHEELKEIFLAEALEGHEELNRLFTLLEHKSNDKEAIDAIFRITHTLKANAAGMGYMDIAEMSHILEDIFSEVRSGKLEIAKSLFDDLYKAVDIIGVQIEAIRSNQPSTARFKGLKTKLEVVLRNCRHGAGSIPEQKSKKKNIQEKVISEIVEVTEEPADDSNVPADENTEDDFSSVQSSKISFSDLIQIPVRKLDILMNLVGELIIERDRITTVYSQNNTRNTEFARLQRITADIQYSVMDVRLVQVNILFNKFHRIVRDTAQLENKKVNLKLEGTENEIDRNVLQIISDSLIHLVRNAISHGIESPEERIRKNKTSDGQVTIRSRNEKDVVVIEVEDDGNGIDENIIRKKAIEKGIVTEEYLAVLSRDEIIELIFEPGFSSAETITEVSGRGVGMDVVKRSIDTIGGKISIETEVGKGSIFRLFLPSSMALKGALLFELSDETYAIPLSYTDAVVQIQTKDIHKAGKGLITNHLNKTISVLFLHKFLSADSEAELYTDTFLQNSIDTIQSERLFLVVVSHGNRTVGLVVDKPLQQKEIVEKKLYPPLDNIRFVSGATILGNGKVCLVLDISSILSSIFRSRK